MQHEVLGTNWEYVPKRIIFKLHGQGGSIYLVEMYSLGRKICHLGYLLCFQTTLRPTSE